MKIATWNVNSIRARQEIVIDYLKENPIEILCIQELKVEDDKFPQKPFEEIGYHLAINGQKAYNGVAILSKFPFEEIRKDLIKAGEQKRTIEALIKGIRILNVYFPHGGFRGEEKFFYKLEFYMKIKNYIVRNNYLSEKFIILGDFNVALEDNDVWDAELLRGAIGFIDEEREALREIISLGFVDVLRSHHDNERIFTWWDYRAGSFRKNEGMRIDYILITPAVESLVKEAYVDTKPRKLKDTSDHAPVVLDLQI